MRQATLKLKEYASNINVINKNAEKFMLRVMFLTFLALIAWYVLLLGNIVFNIIERKTAEASVRALSSEVSDLELEYLSISNNIDLNLSYSMGFKEISAKFATRKSLDALGSNTIDGPVGSIKFTKNEI